MWLLLIAAAILVEVTSARGPCAWRRYRSRYFIWGQLTEACHDAVYIVVVVVVVTVSRGAI